MFTGNQAFNMCPSKTQCEDMLRDAWTLAIETLNWIELKRVGERLALIKIIKQLKIKDPKAIGLAHRLVTETLRKKNFIDFILNTVLEPQQLNDLKIQTQTFLRLYFYETKLSDSNIDKAQRIAQMGRKILGWWKLNDIESVLGKLLSINTENAIKELEETEKVALKTYHPPWFVKYCYRLFGRAEALKFLEKSAYITPVYIRLNTLKATNEVLIKKIQDEQITFEKVSQLKHTYKLLETKKPLTRTESFKQGLFFIQDKASCLAAEVADPKQYTTVLDICAAPGSKTTYLAQLMNNTGNVFSFDYSSRRIRVWKREAKRMGTKNVQPIVSDVRTGLPLKVFADLVILDPPCTSTGTFGKNPDAKWRLTKRSILGMSRIQAQMLDNCKDYVKKGGFLVYSTCSITIEENEMIIQNFLKYNPEFKLVEPNPRIGLPGLRGLTKCQRLYPHIHECNGFFIAKMEKEI
ncbi:NOL1/NOP2/sun family putative RNA methylase [Candidatus Bathyarchaeota archaeon]|nr:NOL1/NOP2/sun family putative RNA methylase [Candidatus Bathyarchaeota archaeon]